MAILDASIFVMRPAPRDRGVRIAKSHFDALAGASGAPRRRLRGSFETGPRRWVAWHFDNLTWWERVRSGAYRWERLGLAT